MLRTGFLIVTVSATTGYAVQFVGAGTLTVTPAPLTVTANSFDKQYGDSYTFAGTEFSTSGLVNGDSVRTCRAAALRRRRPSSTDKLICITPQESDQMQPTAEADRR